MQHEIPLGPSAAIDGEAVMDAGRDLEAHTAAIESPVIVVGHHGCQCGQGRPRVDCQERVEIAAKSGQLERAVGGSQIADPD